MMLFEADSVVSGYGALEVLHGVSLSIEEGEIVSVLGANGAGKTTFLRTVSGVLDTWEGKITLEGADLGPLTPARRAIWLPVFRSCSGRTDAPQRSVYPPRAHPPNLPPDSSGRPRWLTDKDQKYVVGRTTVNAAGKARRLKKTDGHVLPPEIVKQNQPS